MYDETEQPDALVDAIAIIGMAGRFPGAQDVQAFWQNIQAGIESITFFTDEELLANGVEPGLLGQPNYVKANGVVEGIDQFDAAFFGFSPREADLLDPQLRLFLECAWSALEGAGYDAPRFAGRIGVFAGVGMNSYLYNNLLAGRHEDQATEAFSDIFQMSIGNDKDFVPTRAAYHLNLTGPSVNVNTACSSSLVAVNMAVHSLLTYQTDIVLAGGVSLPLPQRRGYLYQEGMILSPDGHCRPFDAQSKGTVGGGGVGLVVLRRLNEALAAGDTIHAIIRGCAINNDGADKIGYTAPSITGQAAVIAEALAMANLSPATISYVEAHGTATALGDPIEIAALTEVFSSATDEKQFCALGSVKSNIGHADAAAGVAGLIKTVQALKHRQLPPSLHYTAPNPAIDFANSPFYVNHTLQPWPRHTTPRRAGVSSFGIGGTNAHLILEEAPTLPLVPGQAGRRQQTCQLLPLSAKTPAALAQMVHNLATHLTDQPTVELADVAFTLTNRRPFAYRHTLVVQSVAEAIAHLNGGVQPGKAAAEAPRVAFLFSGQGAQYVNMGRGLYESEPLFRQTLDQCDAILRPLIGESLLALLYPAQSGQHSPAKLDETRYAQPALFMIEYALAQLWMAWGVQPVALVGHSIGEYVAACLAGVFTLTDGLALVAARGQLMQTLAPGAMLAVSLDAASLTPYLKDGIALAAVNEADRTVVAGPLEAMALLEAQLQTVGIPYRRLHTSHAFHSAMMEPILAEFTARVARVRLQPPTKPYLSNVTGTWITVEDATNPAYWARHLRQTVRFADNLTTLSGAADLLLEVGPGHTLATFARRHADLAARPILTSLRHPQATPSDMAHLLETMGQLWQAGMALDWDAYYGDSPQRRLPLPTYPFQRQRHWVEPALTKPDRQYAQGSATALARQPIEKWCYAPSWRQAPLPRQPLLPATTWLLFNDHVGLGDALAATLQALGQRVILVTAGTAFAQSDDNHFVINPAVAAEYSRLLQTVQQVTAGAFPQKIVHLWNVTTETPPEYPHTVAEAAAINSFYSLVYLAQALGAQHITDALEITLVANQLHNITGEEALQPYKALLTGPLRVLPQEYGNLTCRSIEIEWPTTTAVTHLCRELTTRSATATEVEPVVAYRGPHRWVAAVQPIQLATPPSAVTAPTFPLRTGGVYLITGGLGGIGLTLAELLASWGAKLALVGRTPLPAFEHWATWLATHPAADPISHKIRQLQALTEKGAEVALYAADVADADAMQAVLADLHTRFGPVQGVIHSAGVGGDQLIAQTTHEKLAQVLAPKVTGTLVLQQLLRATPLDFFVVCSSLATVLGGLGQIAYTAANAFQDTVAQQAASPGATSAMPMIAINWDSWRDVGMAAYQFTEGEQPYGLAPAEGVQIFQNILASGLSQVLVATQPFDVLQRQDFLPQKTARVTLRQRAVDHPENNQAAYTPIQQWLTDIWQSFLGVEPIGLQDDFFNDLAGDSLNAMGLINRIQQQLGAILHLQSIFEAPTIAQMAAYLEQHYADALQNQLGFTVQRRATTPAQVTAPLMTQVRQALANKHVLAPYPDEACPPAVFILSPPRSGSTLLRVMLTGHPQLFAPPELGLLHYNTLAEMLADDQYNMGRQGLLRTLMQIDNCTLAQAEQKLATYQAQQLSVPQLYRTLQQAIAPRLLVDKTPSYVFDPATLCQAEALFANAHYIHLMRHPYGMIHSFEEAHLDLLPATANLALDPRAQAELTWLISHEHVIDFLRTIPAQRQHWLTFEELVTQPQQAMTALCRFLNLDFHSAMVDPYSDSHARMTDGVHTEGRMIGDPKFHQHQGIDPAVATQWRAYYQHDFLSDRTMALATQLGYTEWVQPSQPAPLPMNELPQPAAKPLADPTQLLATVDQLSEAEMDALLLTLLENTPS